MLRSHKLPYWCDNYAPSQPFPLLNGLFSLEFLSLSKENLLNTLQGGQHACRCSSQNNLSMVYLWNSWKGGTIWEKALLYGWWKKKHGKRNINNQKLSKTGLGPWGNKPQGILGLPEDCRLDLLLFFIPGEYQISFWWCITLWKKNIH